MRASSLAATLAAAAVLAAPGLVSAQGLNITPAVGVFIPASDLEGVREGLEATEYSREGTMALGLNIEAGWLRGSVAYASGATISGEGTQGEVGDGSVLAVAADVVLRPLPRLFIQPYALVGGGFKRQNFSYEDEGLNSNPLPADQRDLTLHFGLGADVMLGRIGIMAEVTDFLSQTADDEWGQHDAFAMLGLRIRL